MSGELTDGGLELARYLILGTLGVFVFSLAWDFVRGLIRG